MSENETSFPHRWRDQLGGVWMQRAPRTGKAGNWKIISGQFIAFLWVLGHKADADGINRRPPGQDWLSRASRTSTDSVRRYYEAAEALGVISLIKSANGRYVTGYHLVMAPAWMVEDNWPRARAVLQEDRRLKEQAEERKRQHAKKEAAQARREMAERRAATDSARADSPAAVVRVDSARADSLAPTARGTGPMTPPTPHMQTPETGSTPARADSHGGGRPATESARAESASPHVPASSPHVRELPGTTRGHHDDAPVVPYGADPRARAADDWKTYRAPQIPRPTEPERLRQLRIRISDHVQGCYICGPSRTVDPVHCGHGAALLWDFQDARQEWHRMTDV